MLKHIYILVICLISFELLKFSTLLIYLKNLIVYTKLENFFCQKVILILEKKS